MTGATAGPVPFAAALPDDDRPGDAGYDVVVPSLGRPSLQRLLDSLAAQATGPGVPGPQQVVVVDDRPGPGTPAPLDLRVDPGAGWAPRVVRGFGRGPAAARNLGWRVSSAPWIAFLDDDVELPPGWAAALAADLAACGPQVGGSQGRLHVPLPRDRRPTDWERGTAGLQDAAWATADMAYRRAALQAVSGFDERFPRAYREDADLALRVRRAGWELVRGRRCTTHPVRPADDLVSLRVQRGNADDALMRALHGPQWRRRAQAPPGRLRWHAVTTASAAAAVGGVLSGRVAAAGVFGLAWAALTGDFARRRLAPGPRPGSPGWPDEVRRMLLTSVAIPPAAVLHRLRGQIRYAGGAPGWPPPLRAVLFDRDDTLVDDVPYNGDPDLVRPLPGAAAAVAACRAAGLRVGVVTNQSGVARGLLTRRQVDAVNARVEELLGPFDTWQVCPHGPADGCGCRKPAPGMVLAAARGLGVPPQACALVGDIGADVEAARAAGARGVLVPAPATRPEEVADAPEVAAGIGDAVALLLGGRAGSPRGVPDQDRAPDPAPVAEPDWVRA